MRNDLVITKMIESIEKIRSYVQGCSFEEFSNNDMLIDACVFNLSQLGEIANKIDKEFEEAQSQIPWRQIYGLRNRIIHDYDGINLTLIWEIIADDLPKLLEELNKL